MQAVRPVAPAALVSKFRDGIHDTAQGETKRPAEIRCISLSEMQNLWLAPVAQRIRASDFGSEGWGFESLRAR
jgi:hypothetical protein